MFLSSSSLWLSGLLLVVVPTLLAMAGPIVIRRWASLERLIVNNEVAGFKFATVGVLYAVLLVRSASVPDKVARTPTKAEKAVKVAGESAECHS